MTGHRFDARADVHIECGSRPLRLAASPSDDRALVPGTRRGTTLHLLIAYGGAEFTAGQADGEVVADRNLRGVADDVALGIAGD